MAALVVNTGDDTKIMMSNKEPPVKDSSLTLAINTQLKWIVLVLLIECTIGTLGAQIWKMNHAEESWYLGGLPFPIEEQPFIKCVSCSPLSSPHRTVTCSPSSRIRLSYRQPTALSLQPCGSFFPHRRSRAFVIRCRGCLSGATRVSHSSRLS